MESTLGSAEMRSKRKLNKVNYKQLYFTKLPRAKRVRKQKPNDSCDELFSIEILQREDQRVQIHYIGYDEKYDEWKDETEIECLSKNEAEAESVGACYKPLSPYDILRLRIKRAMTCSRKDSPSVKITMPFDNL